MVSCGSNSWGHSGREVWIQTILLFTSEWIQHKKLKLIHNLFVGRSSYLNVLVSIFIRYT